MVKGAEKDREGREKEGRKKKGKGLLRL